MKITAVHRPSVFVRSPLEGRVLLALGAGEACIAQIVTLLHLPDVPITRATLLKVLVRLSSRGLVERRRAATTVRSYFGHHVSKVSYWRIKAA